MSDTGSVSSKAAAVVRQWEPRPRTLALILSIIALAALLYYAYVRDMLGEPYLIAMAIGGGVGAVEILGRYSYAPTRAVQSWAGFSYILINVAASWAAYECIKVYKVFPAEDSSAHTLNEILTAGFGSLVFMRSSLFKVRVGGSDIGIGPAAILDTLLLVADRGVDRGEAVSRARDIFALSARLTALRVKESRAMASILVKYCLALTQNVDDRTTKDLTDAVTKVVGDMEIPEQIKMDIVALRLGDVVGPDVLEAALATLADRLTAATDPLPTKPRDDAGGGAAAGSESNKGGASIPAAADAIKGDVEPVVIETPAKEDLTAELAKKRKSDEGAPKASIGAAPP